MSVLRIMSVESIMSFLCQLLSITSKLNILCMFNVCMLTICTCSVPKSENKSSRLNDFRVKSASMLFV